MGHSLKTAEQGAAFTHPPLGQVDEVVVGSADIAHEPIELPGLSMSASLTYPIGHMTYCVDSSVVVNKYPSSPGHLQ